MVSSLLRMVHDRVGRHGGQDWRGCATEGRGGGGGVDSYGWKGTFYYLTAYIGLLDIKLYILVAGV